MGTRHWPEDANEGLKEVLEAARDFLAAPHWQRDQKERVLFDLVEREIENERLRTGPELD